MILKIYLTGVIAGLLFPVIDSLSLRYSKNFREHRANTDLRSDINQYRLFPAKLKLLASIIPVFNFIWILTILLIVRFFISTWWYGRKKAFIWWLAGTSIKKHFMFKAKLVKKVFPMYMDYYFSSLEKRHWNYKLAKELSEILKNISVGLVEKQILDSIGMTDEQCMNDAIEMTEEFSKQKEDGTEES